MQVCKTLMDKTLLLLQDVCWKEKKFLKNWTLKLIEVHFDLVALMILSQLGIYIYIYIYISWTSTLISWGFDILKLALQFGCISSLQPHEVVGGNKQLHHESLCPKKKYYIEFKSYEIKVCCLYEGFWIFFFHICIKNFLFLAFFEFIVQTWKFQP
jgi:hypothetical protein